MEGEVDLRDEVVSALEELEKCREKNKQPIHIISELESQLLYSKRIEEDLSSKEEYKNLRDLKKRSYNSRKSMMKDLTYQSLRIAQGF